MSNNPKSRGEEAVKGAKKKKDVDVKRLLNVGKEVQLTFGTYTVKELCVFDLISVVADGLESFVKLLEGPETSSEMELLALLISDEELQDQFCKILALSCQTEDKDLFKQMKTSDLLKVVRALKEVNDYEGDKERF